MDNKRLGEILRLLRGNRTIQEVAEACGISDSALGMYENGKRTPRDPVKVKLAGYYGKTVGEIFYAESSH